MVGKLRLISGLILFVFVLGHFLNHSLGVVSIKAMNEGLKYTVEPWRTTPGTILLLSALGIHVVLAIWSLLTRKTFKMKSWEAWQIVLGLAIPFLLAAHVLGTRGIVEAYKFEAGYGFQLLGMWISFPFRGVLNAVALIVVWLHTCMGWHYWLRLKPWYGRFQTSLFALAIIIPVLALTGFISAGFKVMILAEDENWVNKLLAHPKVTPPELLEFIFGWEFVILTGLVVVLLSVAVFHFVRQVIVSRPGSGRLNYRSLDFRVNRELNLRPGLTALEQIRNAGIPHASVCGGKGRCSTCRIRIDKGLETLDEPSVQETKVLKRIGAAPNVRLACQLVPTQNIEITALLDPAATASDGYSRERSQGGEEQEVAILFADIRAFTKLSESKLPYDVAFLLNRYFAAMGMAIEEADGHLDKFIGDGVMAIFGIDKDVSEGSKDAVKAAVNMATRLEALNKSLEHDLEEPLRIGIGIHSGTAIVGTMGYNRAENLTAIGDVVNAASRLEGLTKEFGAQLIVSEKAASQSGSAFHQFPKHEVEIRGRVEPLSVFVVQSALDLNEQKHVASA
ncbi:MAG: adenylate/guanylate cyclase domain-containing protein [Pseudomonadota bacterium]